MKSDTEIARSIPLELCPYCGSAAILDFAAHPQRSWVDCSNETCGLSGPSLHGAVAAVKAWNNLPRRNSDISDSIKDIILNVGTNIQIAGSISVEDYKEISEHILSIVQSGSYGIRDTLEKILTKSKHTREVAVAVIWNMLAHGSLEFDGNRKLKAT